MSALSIKEQSGRVNVSDEHGNTAILMNSGNGPHTIACADGRVIPYTEKQLMTDAAVIATYNGQLAGYAASGQLINKLGSYLGGASSEALAAAQPKPLPSSVELGELPSPMPGRCALPKAMFPQVRGK